MSASFEFTRYWGTACAARGLTRFIAEIHVPDPLQTPAARLGREFVVASALTPAELDEVLSEIMLLSMNDAGESTWRLTRMSQAEVSSAAGGTWSTHFARSFFRATWIRSTAPAAASHGATS